MILYAKMMKFSVISFVLFFCLFSCGKTMDNGKMLFNDGWRFLLVKDTTQKSGCQIWEFDDKDWEEVSLPHSAHLEPYVCNDMWQGECWYRKEFTVSSDYKQKKMLLEVEGAMGTSRFWLNGKEIAVHAGGYLPVVLDISDHVKSGKNLIAVKLDNRDNPLTGPKPLKKLDFCFYSGLYRDTHLYLKDKVYITHEALAGEVAGGGVFIQTPVVSTERAMVEVNVHVKNEAKYVAGVKVEHKVFFGDKLVAEKTSEGDMLKKDETRYIKEAIEITDPMLWSPRSPNLYNLVTTLWVDGKKAEEQNHRFGVREFTFIDNKLYINGEKSFLRGTNRHQEYPYIGYALSDNAQYRDAKKIKEAGFDFVRLSHYPQSPAFMDACDELGIVVLDAILGWQYYLDDDRFRDFCYNSARQLVRRDRNHPCVLAWEMSLNETTMPVSFMQKLHELTHEEFPVDKIYTAGWQPEVYDIFIQARQHRILHPSELPNKPYLVSEYGDWEYYSRNAGLNQHNFDKQLRVEKSSRQLRSFGEARLLQQCFNVQEAHNDNLATPPAFADAYWVMFDYNSGVHPEHCCSGVMDMTRLPKFATYFYQSQRDLAEDTVLHIASYWNSESALNVKVYSNCDEVELFLNEEPIGKQTPDTGHNSSHLKHPPYTFKLSSFKPGKLEARAYVDGKLVAGKTIVTPEAPVALQISLNESGRKPEAGVNDVVFAYIAVVDKNGTVVSDFSGQVNLKLSGDVELMNLGDIVAEAGIATALLKIGNKAEDIILEADAPGRIQGKLTFKPGFKK